MKILYIRSARKILQNKDELEKKLKVKISIKGGNLTISGNEVDEFFAERVLIALDFPFSIDEAFLLLNEDYVFEILNIKDYTKRHDLNVIRGRIIGKDGKALKVIRELSNSHVVVKDNNIAIIAHCDDFENSHQAVISLIRGSRHGNVYSYLEKSHKGDK